MEIHSYLDQASKALAAQDVDSATAIFDRHLSAHQDNPWVWYTALKIAKQKNDLEKLHEILVSRPFEPLEKQIFVFISEVLVDALNKNASQYLVDSTLRILLHEKDFLPDDKSAPHILDLSIALEHSNPDLFVRIRDSIIAFERLNNLRQSITYKQVRFCLNLGMTSESIFRQLPFILSKPFSQICQALRPTLPAIYRESFIRYINQEITAGTIFEYPSEKIFDIAKCLAALEVSLFWKLIFAARSRYPKAAVNPGGPIGALVSIEKSSRALSANVGRRSQLKIALCVSGQLRGFREAKPTWDRLCLDGHQVTTFVHTWSRVGRRYPVAATAFQIFSGNFLRAFNDACAAYLTDPKQLVQLYPRFFGLYDSEDTITSKELSEFYETKHVDVEDDTPENKIFSNNAHRMYYKNYACYQSARKTGQDFDLFIRIRPDKEVILGDIDWRDVYYLSRTNNMVLCDNGYVLHQLGLVVGDQFAAGGQPAMNVYNSTYLNGLKSALMYDMPTNFTSHVSLAMSLLHAGLDVRGSEDFKLWLGRLMDARYPGLSEIETALRSDIAGRAAVRFDDILLQACSADIAAAIT